MKTSSLLVLGGLALFIASKRSGSPQATFKSTPLDAGLEGNPANNPPEQLINIELKNAGVPLVAYQDNARQSAISRIKSLRKSISDLNQEINRKRAGIAPGDNYSGSYQTKMGIITADQARISAIQLEIDNIQNILGMSVA